MLISKDENTTIITQEKLSVVELVRKLTSEYPKYKFDNLIINLTSLNKLSLEDVIEFLQISNEHRSSKRKNGCQLFPFYQGIFKTLWGRYASAGIHK